MRQETDGLRTIDTTLLNYAQLLQSNFSFTYENLILWVPEYTNS